MASDQAKFAAAYFSGKPAPAHPDTEKTIDELRQWIQKCVTFIETVRKEDLVGAEEGKVAPPWFRGNWLSGDDYLKELVIPNFYFHVTIAYAILRHNGVALGKMDYIGGLTVKEG